jgi:hypothetical protein
MPTDLHRRDYEMRPTERNGPVLLNATYNFHRGGQRCTSVCTVDLDSRQVVRNDDYPTLIGEAALSVDASSAELPHPLDPFVTLPDGTEMRQNGFWRGGTRLSDRYFRLGEIDLDAFQGDGSEERGSLWYYLPPDLCCYVLMNRWSFDVELEMPLADVPAPFFWESVPETPPMLSLHGVSGEEGLAQIDWLIDWPTLPEAYKPVLQILKTVLKIEYGWGCLAEDDTFRLLSYPTASVREYGSHVVHLVGQRVTKAPQVRLSAETQM